MDTKKMVLRQTLAVLAGTALCSAVMDGVFALLGYFDMTVLLGSLVGTALAVGNFFVMALVADLAASKAQKQDVAGGQKLVALSYTLRLPVLFAAVILCGLSGWFQPLALVLPLIFVRPVLTVIELFRKKGGNGA